MNSIESGPNYELTVGDARQQIEAIRGEIMAMGGNDSENESLNRIVVQLEDREITPQEAINRAQGVRDSKQAYH